MNKTKVSLRDIIETPGFTRAFHKMARYSLRTGNEARVECFKQLSFQPNFNVSDLIYGLTLGGEGQVKLEADRYLNSAATINSKEIDNLTSKDCYRALPIFDVHTHPVGIGLNPLEFIRFSEEDLVAHAFITIHAPSGVVVFPKKKKARCLLWEPRSNYTEETLGGIYAELERCMKEQNPDKSAVEYLRLYGQADTVDFILKDRLWHPEPKHLERLSKFELVEDEDE